MPSSLKRTLALAAVIILLGFVLRIHQIDTFSFWTDEGLTPYRSGFSIPEILSNRIIIQEGVTNDTHPALFFLIIHFSRRLFGETDFAFRFPSLLFSVLTIPLALQLGRRLYNVRLGLIFAALLAINPLQIWYANEARMYPLLVLLVMGAAYVLWRAIELSQSKTKRAFLPMPVYVVLYFALASLAVYTHYTAVFIIIVQSLFWVWILWRSGFKKLLTGTAVAAILVIIPLIPYTVPRIFKGYEANFSYVSPATMLRDVYRFFALGMTVDYQSPVIQLLLYLLLGLALLGLYAAKPNYRRLFLLTYLLAVVIGLMGGSLIKPMYQGVRHIMAGSPAYLILVGWGLLFAVERAQTARKNRRMAWGVLAAVALLAILLSSAAAIHNYYADEAFGKRDLRGRIQFIEERAGENDVIVYHDAVLLPLHAHYQTRPDVAVTSSPVYGTTAVQTSASQLAELAQTYDHIWFIPGGPADKRDETDIVPRWLDANLIRVDSFIRESAAGNVETRLYATQTETAVPPTPPLAQWPEWPVLSNYELQSTQPLSLPGVWFDLFWESEDSPAGDLGLQFQLRDENGRIRARHTAPITQGNRAWQPTAPNRQSYLLPLETGTPPGRYTLHAQPVRITKDGDAPLHDSIELGAITIAPNSGWPGQPAWTAQSPRLSFANGFALQKSILLDTSVRPGHTLPLILYWKTGEAAQTGLRYELTVTGKNGEVLRTQSDKPGANWLDEWPPNTLFREDTGLYFPPEAEPGEYSVHVTLFQDESPVVGRPFWRPWAAESNEIGRIRVEPWPIETELPADATPINAQFGSAIELSGYQLAQNDTALNLILYWRAAAVPDQNLFTFVHLTDEAGNIVAQMDYVPANGLRPTTGWRAGELITDPYTLPLPPDLPAGTYRLSVGLFDPETFERPFVTWQGQPQPDNQITLPEAINVE